MHNLLNSKKKDTIWSLDQKQVLPMHFFFSGADIVIYFTSKHFQAIYILLMWFLIYYRHNIIVLAKNIG